MIHILWWWGKYINIMKTSNIKLPENMYCGTILIDCKIGSEIPAD